MYKFYVLNHSKLLTYVGTLVVMFVVLLVKVVDVLKEFRETLNKERYGEWVLWSLAK